jgi:hypothetical protein
VLFLCLKGGESMILTKDSGLVKIWAGLVLNQDSLYELKDVPGLFNLKEVVTEVVNSMN